MRKEAEALLAFPEFLFHELAGGQIAEDFAVTFELSMRVAVSSHCSASPEPAAVPPDMPAFIFRAAVATSNCELEFVLTTGAIFWCKDHRTGLSQNLGRRVLKDVLRSPTPTCHAPSNVEGDECVVGYAL